MASAASQTWTARQSWQVVKEFFNDVFADERQGQRQQSNPFRKRDEAVVKDRFDFVIGGFAALALSDGHDSVRDALKNASLPVALTGPALVYVPALFCEGDYKARLEAAALKANRLVQLVTDQVEYRRALAGARQASVRNPDRARSITQVDQRFEHWDVLAVEQLVAGAAFSEDSEHRYAAIMMVRLAISAGRDELGTPRHMQPRCRDVDAAVTEAIKAALERSLHIGHGDAVISKWQRQLTPAFADAAAHWELRHTREELSHARLALRYRDLFDNLKHWLSSFTLYRAPDERDLPHPPLPQDAHSLAKRSFLPAQRGTFERTRVFA